MTDPGLLLKLRDAEAVTTLAEREPGLDVEVLERRPEGVLRRARDAVMHDGALVDAFPGALPYPALEARRYRGEVVLHRGAYAVRGSSLLPESFRWHLSEHPVNESLRDVDARHARLKRRARLAEPEHLPGSYYYLDYRNTGHYGHLITEAVARLWAWPEAKAAVPGLKVLLRHHDNRPKRDRFRRDVPLLRAFGVDADDVAWFREPVRVDDLVGCTPMFQNADPYYVHPDLRAVYDRIRSGLVGDGADGPERVFVTRHGGNRPCRNVAEVDRFFADHGFTVVNPGALTLAQQAAALSGARVVAGLGGAGLFNTAFTRRLETMVVLNHTSYRARNEELLAAMLGAECHLFWSRPDREHPPGGFDVEAFMSPWDFDFARNADQLAAVLDAA